MDLIGQIICLIEFSLYSSGTELQTERKLIANKKAMNAKWRECITKMKGIQVQTERKWIANWKECNCNMKGHALQKKRNWNYAHWQEMNSTANRKDMNCWLDMNSRRSPLYSWTTHQNQLHIHQGEILFMGFLHMSINKWCEMVNGSFHMWLARMIFGVPPG